jgi:periplasmic protein CpxP/Spy
MDHRPREDVLRNLILIPALALMAAGAASAQSIDQTNNASPPRGTGQTNEPVNPNGNAASSVNASGTIRIVSMADLAKGANSFTEGQALSRIESAGFSKVTGLAKDSDGIWRGHAEKEGRTLDVGFDFKGQLASQ